MIAINGLNKNFGKVRALQNLTLAIPAGQVYGLIGPNGAGKTTVMSILATLLVADSGTALVNGLDVTVAPKKVRRIVGYMPDFFGVYHGLTAREYLSFFAAAYYIPAAKHELLINDLLELVNLQDKETTAVDNLSRGMKQRLALARCLIHDPEILILDEPASGLDPRARAEMKEIVLQLKQLGKTVLISSHILPELAEMCDQVGIMENGQLVASGSVAEINAGSSGKKVINIETSGLLTELITYLTEYSGVSQVHQVDGRIRLMFSGDSQAQRSLLKALIQQDYPVLQFVEQQGNLEDAFMAVTKTKEGISK